MLNEATTWLKVGDYSKARLILLKAVEFRPRITDSATIEWVLGSLEATWLFQDQFEEQIAFFSDYVRRYPGDVAGYRGRGSALWYLGRLRDAIADYSRALELNPTDILSRSGRGQILAEIGEVGKAMDDLDIALRLLNAVQKPAENWISWRKDLEAFVRRGRAGALAGNGQIREAMNEFDASIDLCPDNAWAYFSRGQVYDRIGEHARALSDYSTALAKTKPSLSPTQKESAQARISALSGAPDS